MMGRLRSVFRNKFDAPQHLQEDNIAAHTLSDKRRHLIS